MAMADANSLPVRAIPVCTSSAMKSTFFALHSCDGLADVVIVRHEHAGLALDRLHKKGAHVGVFQRLLQRRDIVVRDSDEARACMDRRRSLLSGSVLALMMVMVRPWKLPSHTMIFASFFAILFFS